MKKKKIKLCLTKQLLNMFKLWCEWGIRVLTAIVLKRKNIDNNINCYSFIQPLKDLRKKETIKQTNSVQNLLVHIEISCATL